MWIVESNKTSVDEKPVGHSIFSVYAVEFKIYSTQLSNNVNNLLI